MLTTQMEPSRKFAGGRRASLSELDAEVDAVARTWYETATEGYRPGGDWDACDESARRAFRHRARAAIAALDAHRAADTGALQRDFSAHWPSWLLMVVAPVFLWLDLAEVALLAMAGSMGLRLLNRLAMPKGSSKSSEPSR
jgi:hypothetical protein